MIKRTGRAACMQAISKADVKIGNVYAQGRRSRRSGAHRPRARQRRLGPRQDRRRDQDQGSSSAQRDHASSGRRQRTASAEQARRSGRRQGGVVDKESIEAELGDAERRRARRLRRDGLGTGRERGADEREGRARGRRDQPRRRRARDRADEQIVVGKRQSKSTATLQTARSAKSCSTSISTALSLRRRQTRRQLRQAQARRADNPNWHVAPS